MRKAILVIVLVAASFLGGAFVNGPGLQWVETRVLRSLGLNNGGEIASVDLKPAGNSEMGPDELRLARPGIDVPKGPHAPVPSVLAEHDSSRHDDSDRCFGAPDRTEIKFWRVRCAGLSTNPLAPLASKRPVALTKRLKRQIAPADPDVNQASTTPRPVGSEASEHPDPNAKPDILDTLAALLPSNSGIHRLTLAIFTTL